MILQPGANAYDRRIDGLPPIECQNMYPETVPADVGARWVLVTSPGQELFSDLSNEPRGGFASYGVFDGDVFALYGVNLFRVNSAGVSTFMGVVTGTDRAYFTSVRGVVVLVADGKGWVCDGTTVTEITDADLPAVSSCAAMDGRIIFTEEGTDRLWWSGIFDSGNIDALAFATAETFEDQLVRVIADHRELWLFGQQTIEIWRPVPDFEQPFQRIGDMVLEKGCLSPLSIAKADNTLYWVGQDAIVYRARGGGFERISNHGIDRVLSELSQEALSQVSAYSYTDDGHIFYELTVQGVATYTYDASVNEWATRKSFESNVHSPIDIVDAFSRNIAITEGGLTVVSREHLTEIDEPIERVVSVNIPSSARQAVERLGITVFALDENGAEVDATLQISFSDDAGRTYSPEIAYKTHGQGSFNQRLQLYRQGQLRAPGRTYRIRCVDAVRLTIGPMFLNEAGF